HTIFIKLGTSQVRDGLSTEEWNELNTKLWNFFKEKI
ncbi:unnamed protein product, partial [marine sediment metagenome]